MRKLAFVAPLLLMLVSGCAISLPSFFTVNPFSSAPSSPYGNFIKDAPEVAIKKLAEDSVNQLAASYPPATTRFDFQHDARDAFGSLLVGTLRAKGYAILEFNPKEPHESNQADHFRYVLSQISDLGLYRVTLQTGSESLTRAYRLKENSVYPAGAWVRKE